MIDGKRVICWTPWGRRRTAEILVRYVERDVHRGIVDEYWPCMNTPPGEAGIADAGFAYDLAFDLPWVKPHEFPDGWTPLTPLQRNTGSFYRYMTDPDTVYIRLDDDICYIHDQAIERLVRAKIAQPRTTACMAMIINNAVCSFFGQAHGVIPREWGEVGNYCMDGRGWADGSFAVKLHHLLLDHIAAGTVEKLFLYQDVALQIGQQFSVSCFASAGEMYAGLPDGPGVLVPDEEEFYHTVYRTQMTGNPNVIIGNALVSHYSFGPQHALLFKTDVLDRYREAADKLVIPA